MLTILTFYISFVRIVMTICRKNGENLFQWSGSHCLPMNEAKCSVFNIVRKKSFSCIDIFTSNRVPLLKVSTVKILGVFFSSELK